MRETSVESYRKIMENGLLSRVNTMVYSCLYLHGSQTIKEVCQKLPGMPETTISPRFADLERRGVITTNSKRPCSITGNMAMVWEVTGDLPVKLSKNGKIKCRHCKGRGYTIDTQGKLL